MNIQIAYVLCPLCEVTNQIRWEPNKHSDMCDEIEHFTECDHCKLPAENMQYIGETTRWIPQRRVKK